MLLTNTINAVVTNTQVILSNVIGTQCVVVGLLAPCAAAPAEAMRSERHRWHALSRHDRGCDQKPSKQMPGDRSGRLLSQLMQMPEQWLGWSSFSFSGSSFGFCGCCS